MDLSVGGISYVEQLILYELWAGERLSLEMAHPRYLRPERPISVSAVPFGPGIDIWRSRRIIGALMRSLCLLPGGLRRLCLALLVLIIVGLHLQWVADTDEDLPIPDDGFGPDLPVALVGNHARFRGAR